MKKFILTLSIVLCACKFSAAQTLTNLVWLPYPLQVTQLTNVLGKNYLAVSCFDSLTNQWQYDSTDAFLPLSYTYDNGMLVYGESGGTSFSLMLYDFEKHQFVDTAFTQAGATFSLFFLHDLWATIQFDNTPSLTYPLYFVTYNIASGTFVYYQTNPAYVTFNAHLNGFLYSYEVTEVPNMLYVNTSYYGFNNPAVLYFESVLKEVKDGVVKFENDNTGNSYVKFYAPDAQGVTGLPDPTSSFNHLITNNTSEGIVTYADDYTTTVAMPDTWLNQWVTSTINKTFDYIWIDDGIVLLWYDYNLPYWMHVGAYNTTTHQWQMDSVWTDSITNPTSYPEIINGTVTWLDNNMLQHQYGYNDSSGWGNYATTPRLDFCLRNMQSPANHNLIYIRDYSIGYDTVLYDFGDGYGTKSKTASHLYKTNGHYRSLSTGFTVCASANGQSTCKQALFTTALEQGAEEKTILNIFPNPSSGITTINCTECTGNATLNLTDLTGRTVLKTAATFINNQTQLNISHLQRGVYTLTVSDAKNDGAGVKNLKVVKW